MAAVRISRSGMGDVRVRRRQREDLQSLVAEYACSFGGVEVVHVTEQFDTVQPRAAGPRRDFGKRRAAENPRAATRLTYHARSVRDWACLEMR